MIRIVTGKCYWRGPQNGIFSPNYLDIFNISIDERKDAVSYKITKKFFDENKEFEWNLAFLNRRVHEKKNVERGISAAEKYD